jgi:predicted transposase/invertase (TIGR01784 family)
MTKLIRFDWALKNILRNKANFEILEGFLSELLKKDVKILEILESESNKETRTDKLNRVDVLAKIGKKEKVLIEVQASSQWDYLSRILYGTSKLITENISEGEDYKNVIKVYTVSIVYFNLGRGEDYIYKGKTEFVGQNKKDKLELNDNESKLYAGKTDIEDVYPEHYIIKVDQFSEKICSKIDEWIYFLKEEKIKDSFSAKGLRQAKKKLDVLNLSEKDRAIYAGYIEDKRLDSSLLNSYKIEGLVEGEKKGLEKGLLEGEKKGLEKGAIKIATNMLEQNFSIESTVKITKLSRSEVENIQKKLKN